MAANPLRIRVLGAGWYGCHLAMVLLERGHYVEVHEIADRVFAGASGACPSRLHCGAHYPRSHQTRAHCREHYDAFMKRYGHLTSGVPINIYAVASQDSLVDFDNYRQSLRGEMEFITVERPEEYGLQNVDGAILVKERVIVPTRAAEYFQTNLENVLSFNTSPEDSDAGDWDWTIDATFCARDEANIDRYEPCLTVILDGPTDWAVTIMDGPFPSLYRWDADQNLSSLTSAKLTPFCKVSSWAKARHILDSLEDDYVQERAEEMIDQMAHYWPSAKSMYRLEGWRLGVRAMPRSGCDARLVEVLKLADRVLRIRAGKIDAVIHAERLVLEEIDQPAVS